MRRAAEPLLEELAGALEDVAVAIERRDRELAMASLERARAIDELSARFGEAVDVSRETTRYAPRGGARGAVESYADAAGRIDLAVRNVRVLARGTIRALSLDKNVPPEIAGALRELAAGVRGWRARSTTPTTPPGPRARGAARTTRRRRQGEPVRERDRRPDPLGRGRPDCGHGHELRPAAGAVRDASATPRTRSDRGAVAPGAWPCAA